MSTTLEDNKRVTLSLVSWTKCRKNPCTLTMKNILKKLCAQPWLRNSCHVIVVWMSRRTNLFTIQDTTVASADANENEMNNIITTYQSYERQWTESQEWNDSDLRAASTTMTAKERYVYLCTLYMNSQALEPHSIWNHISFLTCTATKATWTMKS